MTRHIWYSEGSGFKQIKKKLTEIGFRIIRKSNPDKAIWRDEEVHLFLDIEF